MTSRAGHPKTMPDQIGSLQAVDRPASANQAAIGALEAIGNTATTNQNVTITNNFTTIKTLVNQLRTDLIAANIIKGAA